MVKLQVVEILTKCMNLLIDKITKKGNKNANNKKSDKIIKRKDNCKT